MPSDKTQNNTANMLHQNRQETLFDAFDEYLERVQLYAGIARDYGYGADLTGMVHAIKKAKAYLKAANDELAEIIAERVEEAGATTVVEAAQKAAAQRSADDKEWWEQ
jgi:hypothetical protein